MKTELVCNGSPSHWIFSSVAAAQAAIATDGSLPIDMQHFPQKHMINHKIGIPLVWTMRQVDDAYAAMFPLIA